jgi:hypothetical protein
MQTPRPTVGAVDAVRLTIRYGGDRFEVIKRSRVRKPLPPSAPLLDDHEHQLGCWAEVRRDGRGVHRPLLVDRLGRDVEVFTSDPDRPISRVAVADPVGTFTLLVPLIDNADEIVIVGPPRSTSSGRRRSKATANRVVDLATFSVGDESSPHGEPGGAK